MEDKELLEKIIAKQSVIIPAMEKTGETKDIPEKLRHAMAAGRGMGRRHREERGPRQGSPSLAVKQFAEEAHRAHRPVRSRDAPADPRVLRAGGPASPTMTTPRSGCSCAVSAIVEEAARYREASSHFAPLRIQLILVFLPIDKGEVVDVLPRVDDAANREEFLVVGVEHPIVADKP